MPSLFFNTISDKSLLPNLFQCWCMGIALEYKARKHQHLTLFHFYTSYTSAVWSATEGVQKGGRPFLAAQYPKWTQHFPSIPPILDLAGWLFQVFSPWDITGEHVCLCHTTKKGDKLRTNTHPGSLGFCRTREACLKWTLEQQNSECTQSRREAPKQAEKTASFLIFINWNENEKMVHKPTGI